MFSHNVSFIVLDRRNTLVQWWTISTLTGYLSPFEQCVGVVLPTFANTYNHDHQIAHRFDINSNTHSRPFFKNPVFTFLISVLKAWRIKINIFHFFMFCWPCILLNPSHLTSWSLLIRFGLRSTHSLTLE